MHMWMATPDRGLAATLYGPCSVSSTVGEGVPIKLTCRTAYPFEETIRVRVQPERKATFPLYFRMPAWCSHPRVELNGRVMDAKAGPTGFLRISREWEPSDVIELAFAMPVKVEHGYETEFPASVKGYFAFEPAEVFTKRRLPYASVSMGPLLFALPIADQDANTPVPGARWQYALDNAASQNGADIRVQHRPMPSTWNWPLDAPVTLTVPAQAIDWNPTDAQALPSGPVTGKGAESIRLVPYGCTKFRISMFPVTH